MSTTKRIPLTLGLFGFGTVGEALYRVLQHTPSFDGEIRRVCIKHPEKPRQAPADLFTTEAALLLEDPAINTIVELIDDAEAAYHIVKAALLAGKAVVSANKKMIARHLPELLELQQATGASFLYEAAACASIPVIRNLEEYYDNDLLQGFRGIVNGSTNYILTQVFQKGIGFDEALQEAQAAGFAESDPSLDVLGIDAANKLTLLLAHAYGIVADPTELAFNGIQNLHPADARLAHEKRYQIKLVAQAHRLPQGGVAAFVLPQFVRPDDQLYHVAQEYNGVVIESGLAENQFFYGKGAGGIATASAVLSDLSALRYGYRYEYKKRSYGASTILDRAFYLRVYLSCEDLDQIPHERFERIEEWASTGSRCWVSGIIPFAALEENDWWKRPSVSLILQPDAIVEALPVRTTARTSIPALA